MKKLIKFASMLSLAIFMPMAALAQVVVVAPPASGCAGGGLGQMICTIHNLLNKIVPVLLALGVVYFVWGVVQYVIADGEEAKKSGKDRIIYGIIGFAVIVGLWGLVNVIVTTFDLRGSAPTLEPMMGGNNACDLLDNPKLGDLFSYITCIIERSVIPLIFALAILVFVWGVVQFTILGAGEEAKRTQGKQLMIWGIIALTVMLSIWGLVAIVGGTFFDIDYLPTANPR